MLCLPPAPPRAAPAPVRARCGRPRRLRTGGRSARGARRRRAPSGLAPSGVAASGLAGAGLGGARGLGARAARCPGAAAGRSASCRAGRGRPGAASVGCVEAPGISTLPVVGADAGGGAGSVPWIGGGSFSVLELRHRLARRQHRLAAAAAICCGVACCGLSAAAASSARARPAGATVATPLAARWIVVRQLEPVARVGGLRLLPGQRDQVDDRLHRLGLLLRP